MSYENLKCNLKVGSVVPAFLTLLYLTNVISFGVFQLLLLLFLLVFIVFPLIYKYSYSLQRNAVFLNFVNLPNNGKLTSPKDYGLDGARNFYLQTDDGMTLGVWQILSSDFDGRESFLSNFNGSNRNADEGMQEGGGEEEENEVYQRDMNTRNVILYNHGNSGTRASSHRIELYKILRKHFHVIAFDYRSYGDSSPVEPTEDGLVKDVKFVFNWISNRTSSRIFVWGHSLGTGLSMHAFALLNEENKQPYGIILESPFNNMRDEVAEHPIAKYFKPLPWFHYTVVDPMQSNNFIFKSDVHINNVDCPILILHAEDDAVVPFKLGYKLYKTAKAARKQNQGSVNLIEFEKKFGFGHKYICRAPNLHQIIKNFVEDSIKENETKQLIASTVTTVH